MQGFGSIENLYTPSLDLFVGAICYTYKVLGLRANGFNEFSRALVLRAGLFGILNGKFALYKALRTNFSTVAYPWQLISPAYSILYSSCFGASL